MDLSKNRLQERFQKLRLPLPIYSTDSGMNGWTCTVTLANGQTFRATSRLNKRDAEKIAAAIALEWIEDNPDVFTPIPSSPSLSSPPSPTSEIVLTQTSTVPVVVSNTKGALQEMFQGTGAALPSYATAFMRNGYCSTVKLSDGKCFTSDERATKIEAEKHAAQLALDWYSRTSQTEKHATQSALDWHPRTSQTEKHAVQPGTSQAEKNVTVFVDLENVGDEQSFMILVRLKEYKIKVIAVASSNYTNTVVRRYIDDVRIVSTIVKEASDVYITLLVAKMIYSEKEVHHIFILSRDHFAAAVPIVLKETGMGDNAVTVCHVLTVQQLTKELADKNLLVKR